MKKMKMSNQGLLHRYCKGRTIRKMMGGGGAKKKIEQGKQKERKICAPKKFEKKNSCRLFR
jgi:hypothetical protein